MNKHREIEPDDAGRGTVNPIPRDRHEAAADREIADAERARVQGRASRHQLHRLHAVDELRTVEDRRARWMAS